MALRKRKPTSPGRRFQTVSDFAEITKDTPEKSLLAKKRGTGGRNNHGRKTSRHRGGGHKQRYRVVDFRRNKDGVEAKVVAIEYDPNRTCRILLLHYARRREVLHPRPARACRSATACSRARARRSGPATPCRCATSPSARPSTTSSCGRAAAARWPARPARRCSSSPRKATSPPCGCRRTEMRRVPIDCRATVGEVGNAEHELIKIGKAGRNRWKGVKPQTRGVAMNPVDHPLGGGEGKTSGGRHPVSPWGKPEGRTRDKNKPSQKLIVRRRRTRGSRR